MWKEIEKITLKALIDVRIRFEGEKQDFRAGDLIEVDNRNMRFYLMNWFGYENDEIVKVEKKGKDKKETTEIVDDPEAVKKEQAEKAKLKAENK